MNLLCVFQLSLTPRPLIEVGESIYNRDNYSDHYRQQQQPQQQGNKVQTKTIQTAALSKHIFLLVSTRG